MDPTSLAILISTGSAALVAVLSQIQHSKCITMNLCFGCIKCTRGIQNSAVEMQDIEKNLESITNDATQAETKGQRVQGKIEDSRSITQGAAPPDWSHLIR